MRLAPLLLHASLMRAVLFDIDGTLLDSNDAHARAWLDAAAEMGLPATLSSVRRAIGMGGDHLMPALFDLTKDSPRGKALSKRRGEIFRTRYLANTQPFPRVRDLLYAVRARGLKIVGATSSSPDDVNLLLKQAGVADLLEHFTSSGDAPRSKPSPDILQAALDVAQVPPIEAVMIGDTPYDVTAARAAGVRSVALLTGGWSAPELNGATWIFRDPAHLLEHLGDVVEA